MMMMMMMMLIILMIVIVMRYNDDDDAYICYIHEDNATQLLERSSQQRETLKDSEINLKNLIEHYKMEVWWIYDYDDDGDMIVWYDCDDGTSEVIHMLVYVDFMYVTMIYISIISIYPMLIIYLSIIIYHIVIRSYLYK